MYNGHGDVTNLIDETGKTIGSYYYDAFGKVTESKSSIKNPYRYAGYQYDEEIEKYYLRNRMYDPNTARFMQEDTYRGNPKDPLSLNTYTYCHNNPIIYDDPTGHWWHIAAAALLGGVVNTIINAVSDYRDDGKFNSGWKSYVGAFVEGAIDGGTIAATGGTSLLADVGAGFIGNTANQLISKGKVDVKEATVAGATNLGFGLAGKGISKVKPSKVIAKSNEIVNNITAGLKQKFSFKGLKPSFAGGYGSNKGISANLGYDSAVRKNWHEAISNKDEIQKSFSFAEGNGGITAEGRDPITKSQYKKLRRKTPNNDIRKMVNHEGTKVDPVYGYKVEKLEADHIVSMKQITEMSGFSQLSEQQQIEVLNLKDNFVGLGKPSNASKGAKSWGEWKGHSKLGDVPEEVRQQMLELESSSREALKKAIEERLK